MKERSDDAILVFPLLCPPPSCHNMEFQKRERCWRELNVATSRQSSAIYYIQELLVENEMMYNPENIMATVNSAGK